MTLYPVHPKAFTHSTICGEIVMINSIRKNQGSIKVELEVLVSKEGDYFVAYCPALELSSYGATEKEAALLP